MKKEEIRELSKYFFWVLIAILLFLSFKIIQPYLITLVSAFILAYFSRPLYKKLENKIGQTFSAIICIILILLIIILPLSALIGGISSQAIEFSKNANYSNLADNLNSIPIISNLNIDFNELSQKGTLAILNLLTSAISYIPSLIITLIILLFGIFYFLIGWKEITSKLKEYIPFKEKQKIANEISDATRNIIFGFLLIAIIQFIIAVLGFYISGVKAFLLLPIIIFFLAFLPGLGPAIVWIPMSIYYFATKNWVVFIGVLITGIILSFVVDIILRAKIMGKKTNINPLIMLIGILGGISLFGIFGFIIGPLILVYAIKLSYKIVKTKN